MPFQTDTTWTPTAYRKAYAHWSANAPRIDSDILPRRAATEAPRHGKLATQLRSLLTWRAVSTESDWTIAAANDNEDEEGERVPVLLDSELETRPRLQEINAALKPVKFVTRKHAKLGGGGEREHKVPVSGDIEHGRPEHQPRSRTHRADCVVRLGGLTFSNGAQEVKCLVRNDAGKIAAGTDRIPLGGLVACDGYKSRDRFTKPKGPPVADNDNLTVGVSETASPGAFQFRDPVAEADERQRLREAVKPETAVVLDMALRAANLSEIGVMLGKQGKHAERAGKAALQAACRELDEVLRAA